MIWRRFAHPTGVPFYTSDSAPGYQIEAIQKHACHAGMVFGNPVSNADQGVRTTGWRVVFEGRQVLSTSKLAAAKAAVERRVAS